MAITLGSLAPNMGPPPTFGFDKIIHASAYGGLALLLACRLPPWLALCVAVGLGGGLEIAQGSIPGRLGSWGDFAANGTGALVGVLVRVALRKLMRRR
ncbi:VanZ family protein [Rhodospirillum rubrum]|uniref:VanZ family protein n=1 Tax=Rhodospirillum rubrum TaxID=1085 RepID=UPI001F5B9DAA|nr:VanZ family protein [Rhodospirillum rubrum]